MNLVVMGLKEASSVADDRKVLNEAVSILGLSPSAVVDSFRDGKRTGDRPRILKIKFSDASSRRAFLTGFQGAREKITGAASAWVRPDLTYKQRQADREVRAELQRRRDAGEKVKISRGKVIQVN